MHIQLTPVSWLGPSLRPPPRSRLKPCRPDVWQATAIQELAKERQYEVRPSDRPIKVS